MITQSMPSNSDDPGASEQELLEAALIPALLREQASRTATPAQGDASASDGMPVTLAERIVADGERHVRAMHAPKVSVQAGSRLLMWSGWLAAAAMLLFMVRTGSARRDVSDPGTGGTTIRTVVDARVALRDSLLATPGVLRKEWTTTTDSTAATASGEVLWDPVSGRGIMRFTGLAANMPNAWQYQLWIFDAQRDERYPVDGGVFDVAATNGEVLIPVRARVPVGKATLFAVTVEAPGGVVVSKRERIVVTAQM